MTSITIQLNSKLSTVITSVLLQIVYAIERDNIISYEVLSSIFNSNFSSNGKSMNSQDNVIITTAK